MADSDSSLSDIVNHASKYYSVTLPPGPTDASAPLSLYFLTNKQQLIPRILWINTRAPPKVMSNRQHPSDSSRPRAGSPSFLLPIFSLMTCSLLVETMGSAEVHSVKEWRYSLEGLLSLDIAVLQAGLGHHVNCMVCAQRHLSRGCRQDHEA